MDVDLGLVGKILATGAVSAGLLFLAMLVLTMPDRDWEYHDGDDGPGND